MQKILKKNKNIVSGKIYLDAPNVGRLEKEYLNKAIDSGYVSTVGPFVVDFEAQFARYVDVKKAVSTQSGTAALHVCLYALGIKPGDEVIVPALTFIATVNPIIYVGAVPVFVDADENSWNMDASKIEEKISKKTKAIIPVHLYGNPCEMDKILKIAKKYKLKVIEDATESLGALYKGNPTGTLGDFGFYSFNGNKLITTGGGGMIVGHDIKSLERIKFLINQAKDESQDYNHPEIGFNYRMTNIEAAIGLAQLSRINDFLNKKKKFERIYRSQLRNIDEIRFQESYDGASSSAWLFGVKFSSGVNIIRIMNELKLKGIPSRRVFKPIDQMDVYRKFSKSDCRQAKKIYEQSLCLPASTLNKEEDVYYICNNLKEILKKCQP